jgi:translation initiation factor 1A
MAEESNDFEEIGEEGESPEKSPVGEQGQPGMPIRVRMPRKGELVGIVLQRFGGNRMEVQSSDGKKRNCRVPGRYKRALWLRPNDVVLIVPWLDDDSKGDIIYKYNSSGIIHLRKKGLLDSIKAGF